MLQFKTHKKKIGNSKRDYKLMYMQSETENEQQESLKCHLHAQV